MYSIREKNRAVSHVQVLLELQYSGRVATAEPDLPDWGKCFIILAASLLPIGSRVMRACASVSCSSLTSSSPGCLARLGSNVSGKGLAR